MDVKQIRRKRLLQLVNDRFSGVKLRLAEALDMKPPQIHRWLKEGAGGQGMDEESARSIEKALGLEDRWLDLENDQDAQPMIHPEAWALLHTIRQSAINGTLTPEQAKAYDFLIQTQTGQISVEIKTSNKSQQTSTPTTIAEQIASRSDLIHQTPTTKQTNVVRAARTPKSIAKKVSHGD